MPMRARCLLSIFSLISILTVSGVAQAQVLNAVDRVVEDELIKQNIVGGAVAVIRNGKVVHANGYGHKTLARRTKINRNTSFRWASISKSLTAVAVFQADEKGDLSINDRVTKHVNYWPKKGRKGSVTVKQLLSHRSGIIHYKTTGACPSNKTPNYNRGRHGDGTYNAKKAVDVFKGQKLCFAPGSRFKYSTFAYSLLAATLEEATGTKYSTWVQKNIVDPLGIRTLRQAKRISTGYDLKCGKLVSAKEGSKTYVLPGGGWVSNIEDLAKFGNGVISGRLLDNASRMWMTPTGNDGGTVLYRLGFQVSNGGQRIAHGGSHNETRTYLHLYPGRADKFGVAVYLNGRHGDARRVARRIAQALGVRNWNISGLPVDQECDDNCPGAYSGVWRKTNRNVILRKGLSHAAFGNERNYLKARGYYVDDFEVYTEKGQLRWDGVFRKGGGDNPMWRNFSFDAFGKKWREMTGKGYRLVDVETYKSGGKRLWAGLFRPGRQRFALFRGLNTNEFGAKQKEMARSGLKTD